MVIFNTTCFSLLRKIGRLRLNDRCALEFLNSEWNVCEIWRDDIKLVLALVKLLSLC